jgi:hypothetical protein
VETPNEFQKIFLGLINRNVWYYLGIPGRGSNVCWIWEYHCLICLASTLDLDFWASTVQWRFSN